jgi:glycine cleavage system H protein
LIKITFYSDKVYRSGPGAWVTLPMKSNPSPKDDIFYTRGHEWIQFQQIVACTGVCAVKLTGFKEVHEIIFHQLSGDKKKGDTIAVIRYNDNEVQVRMPVDGKILQINDALVTGGLKLLLKYPETKGWIAEIIPAIPAQKNKLLTSLEYHLALKDI